MTDTPETPSPARYDSFIDADGTEWKLAGNGRWLRFGKEGTFPRDAAKLPLRRMVPEGYLIPAGGTDREPYGRLVHEQRLAVNAEKERPFVLEPWERRSRDQQEMDMRVGSAIAMRAAAAERERIRQLAIRNGAVCTGDEGTSCYFADLIREPSHA